MARWAACAVLVFAAVVCATPSGSTQAVKDVLGPTPNLPSGPPEEEALSIFEARGAHQTNQGLRDCYDTLRRTACPLSTKQVNGKFVVGTTSKPLECREEDRDGSSLLRKVMILLRAMSKSAFVKNAYFTGPAENGKKPPTNQHFVDVFVGQVIYNVMNAADRSLVTALDSTTKFAYDQLAQANNFWASVKFSVFQGKKERISMGSKALRELLRKLRESKKELWHTCRRVKFVFASMDVGSDLAKYEHEKKVTIGKLINKVVTTALKVTVSAAPIGGDAASSIVAAVSEMVDALIDSAKERKDRKYAVTAILRELFSGFIPPVEDKAPAEAMAQANAAKTTEILGMVHLIQDKLGIVRKTKAQPTPEQQPPKTTPEQSPKKPTTDTSSKTPQTPPIQSQAPSSSKSSSSSKGTKSKFRGHFWREFRRASSEVDSSLLELREREPPGGTDFFKPIKYDEGPECNKKVMALLSLIERMYEDETDEQGRPKGEETPSYTEINSCGPNPAIMSEKENVERAKAIFKLIHYFVTVPDVSEIEAETWLAKMVRISNTVVDKAAEAYDTVTSATGGDS